MPILLGILAAFGLFAATTRASGQGNALVLLRAAMPFGGPVLVGSIVSLLADARDAAGRLAPFAFKVRVVDAPAALEGRPFTAVFMSDVMGAHAGEFLEFTTDKIQNVETS